MPDGVPTIAVNRDGLDRGGPLIVDCSAPPAFPAPNLTWYVNDQRVSQTFLRNKFYKVLFLLFFLLNNETVKVNNNLIVMAN